MKATRSLLALAALFAGLFLGGCKSTWDFWKEDSAQVIRAQRRNFHHINKSLHRHFLNTDWDDPYIDE